MLLTGDNSTFPLYYPFPCRYMINPASMLTSQDVTAFALKTTRTDGHALMAANAYLFPQEIPVIYSVYYE